MNKTALWEALHTRGHDAAHLTSLPDGWRLTGSAVYLTDEKAAGVNYSLDLNSDWSTRCGSFQGFVGGERVNCDIARDDRGWTLNGVRRRGLEGAVDLDFGFTPATNYPQLQRMALKVGQATQITVAWMDVRSDILEPLSQIYCRVSERSYDYHSPRDSYRATLDIAPSGFISLYPGLWSLQASAAQKT